MGLKKVFSGQLEIVHEDSRRFRIIQEVNTQDSSVKLLEVLDVPEAVGRYVQLGHHYHKKCRKVFTLLKGEGWFVSVRIDKDGNPVGNQEIVSVKAGSVCTIPKRTAFLWVLRRGSLLHYFCSKPFDQHDEDIHSFPLDVSSLPLE